MFVMKKIDLVLESSIENDDWFQIIKYTPPQRSPV